MATHAPACTRLHAPHCPPELFRSIALYRALHCFTGPVFAWRVAFGGRDAS